MNNYKYTVEDRFVKYVQIDTTADPISPSFPSSEKQKDLSKVLVEELGVALMSNNFSEVSRLATLITSMSAMMKDDARILLEEVQTGSTCETPEDVIH